MRPITSIMTVFTCLASSSWNIDNVWTLHSDCHIPSLVIFQLIKTWLNPWHMPVLTRILGYINTEIGKWKCFYLVQLVRHFQISWLLGVSVTHLHYFLAPTGRTEMCQYLNGLPLQTLSSALKTLLTIWGFLIGIKPTTRYCTTCHFLNFFTIKCCTFIVIKLLPAV